MYLQCIYFKHYNNAVTQCATIKKKPPKRKAQQYKEAYLFRLQDIWLPHLVLEPQLE
jgi:hypothetical protein